MKHHTSILIFLVAFLLLSALMFKPSKQVYAAQVNTEAITQGQLDTIQQAAGIIIPSTVATTITTKQDFTSYLMVTIGSFLTVVLMAFLKFLLPSVFGSINTK